ncbi:hypothetical protein JCM10207_007306 [Rhodosporidiobolus poonsookiae]
MSLFSPSPPAEPSPPPSPPPSADPPADFAPASLSNEELVDRLVVAVSEQDVLYVHFWLREMRGQGMLEASFGAEGVDKITLRSKRSALRTVCTVPFTPLRLFILQLLLLTMNEPLGEVGEHNEGDAIQGWSTRVMASWDERGRAEAVDAAALLANTDAVAVEDWVTDNLEAPPNEDSLTGCGPLPDSLAPSPDPAGASPAYDEMQLPELISGAPSPEPLRSSTALDSFACARHASTATPRPAITAKRTIPPRQSLHPSLPQRPTFTSNRPPQPFLPITSSEPDHPIRLHVKPLPFGTPNATVEKLFFDAQIPVVPCSLLVRHDDAFLTVPDRASWLAAREKLHRLQFIGNKLIVERDHADFDRSVDDCARDPVVIVEGVPRTASAGDFHKLAQGTGLGAYDAGLRGAGRQGGDAHVVGEFRVSSPFAARMAVQELDGRVWKGGARLRATWRASETEETAEGPSNAFWGEEGGGLPAEKVNFDPREDAPFAFQPPAAARSARSPTPTPSSTRPSPSPSSSPVASKNAPPGLGSFLPPGAQPSRDKLFPSAATASKSRLFNPAAPATTSSGDLAPFLSSIAPSSDDHPIRLHLKPLPLGTTPAAITDLCALWGVAVDPSSFHIRRDDAFFTVPNREAWLAADRGLNDATYNDKVLTVERDHRWRWMSREERESHPSVIVEGLPLHTDPAAFAKLARATRVGPDGESVELFGALGAGAFRVPSPFAAEQAVEALNGLCWEGARLRATWEAGRRETGGEKEKGETSGEKPDGEKAGKKKRRKSKAAPAEQAPARPVVDASASPRGATRVVESTANLAGTGSTRAAVAPRVQPRSPVAAPPSSLLPSSPTTSALAPMSSSQHEAPRPTQAAAALSFALPTSGTSFPPPFLFPGPIPTASSTSAPGDAAAPSQPLAFIPIYHPSQLAALFPQGAPSAFIPSSLAGQAPSTPTTGKRARDDGATYDGSQQGRTRTSADNASTPKKPRVQQLPSPASLSPAASTSSFFSFPPS